MKNIENPVTIWFVVFGGIVYGVYRIAAGEKADIWINEQFSKIKKQ